MIVYAILDFLKRFILSSMLISGLFYLSTHYTITDISVNECVQQMELRETLTDFRQHCKYSFSQTYDQIKNGELSVTTEEFDIEECLTALSEEMDLLMEKVSDSFHNM